MNGLRSLESFDFSENVCSTNKFIETTDSDLVE